MKRVAYSVTATLSMNSGFILNATCQCKCAVLGRCSHVGGLHAVLDHASHAESACTSQLCQWNVGKRKGKQPQSLTDVSYSGDAKRRQIDGVSKFDPRPPSPRTTEPNTSVNVLSSAGVVMWVDYYMLCLIMRVMQSQHAHHNFASGTSANGKANNLKA